MRDHLLVLGIAAGLIGWMIWRSRRSDAVENSDMVGHEVVATDLFEPTPAFPTRPLESGSVLLPPLSAEEMRAKLFGRIEPWMVADVAIQPRFIPPFDPARAQVSGAGCLGC